MARVRRNEYTLFGRNPAFLYIYIYNHKYISKIYILPSENKKKGEETHLPNSFLGDLNQIQKPREVLRFTTKKIWWYIDIPKSSMYGICTYIYHSFLKPNVGKIGKYSIYGAYLIWLHTRDSELVIKVQGRLFRVPIFYQMILLMEEILLTSWGW